MLRILAAGLAGSALLTGWTLLHPPGSPIALPLPIPEIQANDNRTPAGALSGGVLTVELVARQGTWFPEGEAGPGHEVYAFGERGQDLRNPGPLLRVPAGTEIHATVRNEIEGETLIVHGLYDRPGAPDTLHVPPGASRSVRFTANAAGTYLYWATTRGARSLVDRWGKESQLSGALIVDPSGPVPPDRVFVIGIEDDSAAIPALRTVNAAVVNGRSWPHTERFTAHAGDTIRMRWINASDRFHPMHLHGFHFRVESRGLCGVRPAGGGDRADGSGRHIQHDLGAAAPGQLAHALPHDGALQSQAAKGRTRAGPQQPQAQSRTRCDVRPCAGMADSAER
jgi:FtsP/CotA-like multicopper oxidase with cupredoxin domain